ncbi:hypothetical protein NDU88_001549 [Pleurodeles waltl]|uniref:Uncharacterized protein n=1 Tax=Pleurodeles waltl TaxID=8319 RepID=A0AAV7RBL2_PLEWA|nr:hypothetical protein NDU88_001549 [Pleurodeles waltl]
MAVATPSVRLPDPLRRPNISARRAQAIASSAAPRVYLPGSPGPLQLHSSGEIPGQPDNAGTFRAPASPPLWSRRRHTLPAQAQAPPPEAPSDDAAGSAFRPHYPPSPRRQ